ncbi:uncharacterized protein LOC128551436 [Mercenaria mercenaria]|uniref:uncharacterized protein LOC128551436 n=1 Tax=Mercenaria mercenaria TaxID=6596 RepID=UPI00234E428C|nr:uncharacterized protein LOC128551436 [Mercenaria mercenaria]
MKLYIKYEIVMFVLLLGNILSEKNVTLKALSDLKCDYMAVLMCQIKQYETKHIMTLEIDEQPAADCTFKKCQIYKLEGINYGFSFDTSNGIFNITMDPVTFADNGRTFKCDDGCTDAVYNATINVIPENSATTISSSKCQFSTELKATSGCLYPSTSITFQWYYFKAGNSPVLYKESQPYLSTDENGCTDGPCGGKGVVKVTSTLVIQEDPRGEEYYFQVLVKHPDNTDIIIKTDKPFQLERKFDVEQSSVPPVHENNTRAAPVNGSRARKMELNLGGHILFLFLTFYLLKNDEK